MGLDSNSNPRPQPSRHHHPKRMIQRPPIAAPCCLSTRALRARSRAQLSFPPDAPGSPSASWIVHPGRDGGSSSRAKDQRPKTCFGHSAVLDVTPQRGPAKRTRSRADADALQMPAGAEFVISPIRSVLGVTEHDVVDAVHEARDIEENMLDAGASSHVLVNKRDRVRRPQTAYQGERKGSSIAVSRLEGPEATIRVRGASRTRCAVRERLGEPLTRLAQRDLDPVVHALRAVPRGPSAGNLNESQGCTAHRITRRPPYTDILAPYAGSVKPIPG